jgi:hypothetical protein
MFRRAIGNEIWHSTPECPFWPLMNYDEKETPTIGVRCAQCRELDMGIKPLSINESKGKLATGS